MLQETEKCSTPARKVQVQNGKPAPSSTSYEEDCSKCHSQMGKGASTEQLCFSTQDKDASQ